MAGSLLGQPFDVEQGNSLYPFADGASLQTGDGLAFDPTWLYDARLYMLDATVTVGLMAVTITLDTVTLAFGDADVPDRASASFTANRAIPATLSVVDTAGRLCGMLRANALALSAINGWPTGTHKFAVGAAELVPSVLIPRPEPGVRSLIVPGYPPLAGDVWLVGSNGVVLSVADGAIEFSAVGDPLFVQRACGEGGQFVAPVPLQTINGIGPDETGNFFLVATAAGGPGTILRINPQPPATLIISLAGASASTTLE